MASESQKQKSLLDSGFLDNLGSSRQADLKLDNVERIFVKWMGILITQLQKNLNNESKGAGGYNAEITASGELSASIRLEYSRVGAGLVGKIYMADYADFVDKGVKGIGPGNRNTTSPYSFKKASVSRSFRDALIKWIGDKNITIYPETSKGLLGPDTRKKLSNKIAAQNLATAIGRGIKKKGLRARNFKQVSVEAIQEGMMKEIRMALATDIKIDINLSALK